MPAGILGKGTVIGKGDAASPEVFTTIANVGSITGPTTSSELIDVTNQDTSGSYRQYIAGLIDGGEVSFTLNFDPALAGHQAIFTDLEDQSVDNYQITFSDAATTKCVFPGVVTGAESTAPIDGALQLSVTIKVTGDVTWPGE